MKSDLSNRLKEISESNNYNLFPKIPNKNLLIEVTNRCNLNCIFCANSKMKRTRKMINGDLINKVLNEAYDLGVREVGFYTTGESLLNNQLCSYVNIAKEIGYKYVYLTTNGVLLNKLKIKKLVEAGIDSFKLSINAINSEDYRMIHGLDVFDIVMQNLKDLHVFREKHKLLFKIYVSYIATRYTDYSNQKIINFFKPLCDDVAIINVRNQSGMMPEIDELLSCKYHDDKYPAERLVPCHYVFNTINVSAEGYLTACCTDFENYLAYADLNTTSLKDAWNNEIITNLRKKHLKNCLEGTLCYNCIYNSREVPNPISRKFVENECLKDILYNDKVINRLKKYEKL